MRFDINDLFDPKRKEKPTTPIEVSEATPPRKETEIPFRNKAQTVSSLKPVSDDLLISGTSMRKSTVGKQMRVDLSDPRNVQAFFDNLSRMDRSQLGFGQGTECVHFANCLWIGEVKNGQPNGNGICLFDNFDFYSGEMKGNQFEGQGFYHFHSGNYMFSEFKGGKSSGKSFWKSERTGFSKVTTVNGKIEKATVNKSDNSVSKITSVSKDEKIGNSRLQSPMHSGISQVNKSQRLGIPTQSTIENVSKSHHKKFINGIFAPDDVVNYLRTASLLQKEMEDSQRPDGQIDKIGFQMLFQKLENPIQESFSKQQIPYKEKISNQPMFIGSEKSSFGTFFLPEGDFLHGKFKENKLQKFGLINYIDGVQEVGFMQNVFSSLKTILNGFGKRYYPKMNCIVIGFFDNDKLNGNFIIEHSSQEFYRFVLFENDVPVKVYFQVTERFDWKRFFHHIFIHMIIKLTGRYIAAKNTTVKTDVVDSSILKRNRSDVQLQNGANPNARYMNEITSYFLDRFMGINVATGSLNSKNSLELYRPINAELEEQFKWTPPIEHNVQKAKIIYSSPVDYQQISVYQFQKTLDQSGVENHPQTNTETNPVDPYARYNLPSYPQPVNTQAKDLTEFASFSKNENLNMSEQNKVPQQFQQQSYHQINESQNLSLRNSNVKVNANANDYMQNSQKPLPEYQNGIQSGGMTPDHYETINQYNFKPAEVLQTNTQSQPPEMPPVESLPHYFKMIDPATNVAVPVSNPDDSKQSLYGGYNHAEKRLSMFSFLRNSHLDLFIKPPNNPSTTPNNSNLPSLVQSSHGLPKNHGDNYVNVRSPQPVNNSYSGIDPKPKQSTIDAFMRLDPKPIDPVLTYNGHDGRSPLPSNSHLNQYMTPNESLLPKDTTPVAKYFKESHLDDFKIQPSVNKLKLQSPPTEKATPNEEALILDLSELRKDDYEMYKKLALTYGLDVRAPSDPTNEILRVTPNSITTDNRPSNGTSPNDRFDSIPTTTRTNTITSRTPKGIQDLKPYFVREKTPERNPSPMNSIVSKKSEKRIDTINSYFNQKKAEVKPERDYKEKIPYGYDPDSTREPQKPSRALSNNVAPAPEDRGRKPFLNDQYNDVPIDRVPSFARPQNNNLDSKTNPATEPRYENLNRSPKPTPDNNRRDPQAIEQKYSNGPKNGIPAPDQSMSKTPEKIGGKTKDELLNDIMKRHSVLNKPMPVIPPEQIQNPVKQSQELPAQNYPAQNPVVPQKSTQESDIKRSISPNDDPSSRRKRFEKLIGEMQDVSQSLASNLSNKDDYKNRYREERKKRGYT